eukprot:scaffold50391_cov37-Cyclotella_meneghiniana.AAC.3
MIPPALILGGYDFDATIESDDETLNAMRAQQCNSPPTRGWIDKTINDGTKDVRSENDDDDTTINWQDNIRTTTGVEIEQ